MFYPNGLKIVPVNLIEYLNARVLAFWIMDDGSWTGSGILLHCNSFSYSDTVTLANMLNTKFGLTTSVRAKGNGHIIYIHAASIPKVRELTMKYIHSSFQYKLGIIKETKFVSFVSTN